MADNNAYIGYRSAGRRPESQQDRRASADAPLSALRGMLSGVLGAPGDIESLVRMLPGLSERTVLPTSEDVEKRLPMPELNQTPTGRAFTTAGQLGGGFYTGPGSPLRAIAALPSAVSRAGRDFLLSTSPVNVVKPKGGNWLAGSVERAINPMRIHELQPQRVEDMQNVLANPDKFSPEEVEGTKYFLGRHEQNASLNKWLESKLGKYIRNEMATPEDPLRALADRGVTHIPEGARSLEQVTEWIPEALEGRRAAAGFPRSGMSETTIGQGWEQLADQAIHNMPARMRVDPDTGGGSMVALQTEKDNPWLMKVPPDTMTYGAYPVEVRQELGFEHLVDELRNAVNPESGLPASLSWKYSDLEKVTVPQAVERVAKINEWRAAQKAEADMARAMNPATQVVKEYPEKGMSWVELRQPEIKELPEGYSVNPMDKDGWFAVYGPDGRSTGAVGKSPDEAIANQEFGRQSLEDALKYEGETMGHCVGGYCPDVVEGRSKIYSLRDKKGQPHVTIEVAPDIRPRESYFGEPQDAIVQIKGKANRAPKEEYLPAVQDFIRSGNFGKIGDLQNAGLVDVQDPNALLRALGKVSPERNIDQAIDNFNTAIDSAPNAQRYMTLDELRDFLGGPPPEGFSRGGQVRGYAEGGQVSGANFPTDDFDPDRIDAIVGELHAMNAA